MARTGKRRRILGPLAPVFIVAGLYFALIKAPPDAFQGDAQRIMYLHIPSILTAYLSFFIVFVGSCLYLWKRDGIKTCFIPDMVAANIELAHE